MKKGANYAPFITRFVMEMRKQFAFPLYSSDLKLQRYWLPTTPSSLSIEFIYSAAGASDAGAASAGFSTASFMLRRTRPWRSISSTLT